MVLSDLVFCPCPWRFRATLFLGRVAGVVFWPDIAGHSLKGDVLHRPHYIEVDQKRKVKDQVLLARTGPVGKPRCLASCTRVRF